MADFGYDISDYTGIDPIFGTLADFDRLLEAAHARGLKLLMDFVPNHTSDEHSWFAASRSSRENAKRDWYIWRGSSSEGGPPNNWESYFGGSAWTLDPETGQYYLHTFAAKQPDLNWRNPHVRAAMYDAMQFWLDRGVDGFRLDVLWMLMKDEAFRDNPWNPRWRPGDTYWARQTRKHSEDLEEVHDIVRQMRGVTDQYDERVLVGEIYLPPDRLMQYYGFSLDEVHLPFNFQLTGNITWHPRELRRIVDSYEAMLPPQAWPNWVLGNHDLPRIASRVGRERERLVQTMLLTLRGTPTCYYGDELGMHDVPIPPGQKHNPQGDHALGYGRDPVRTPMQWEVGVNTGFSTGYPLRATRTASA
jgi:alpha-glucosidase